MPTAHERKESDARDSFAPQDFQTRTPNCSRWTNSPAFSKSLAPGSMPTRGRSRAPDSPTSKSESTCDSTNPRFANFSDN